MFTYSKILFSEISVIVKQRRGIGDDQVTMLLALSARMASDSAFARQ
eukprot:COSAG06_NODE_44108_length_366_cov_0.584270_1_plen_46_part_10